MLKLDAGLNSTLGMEAHDELLNARWPKLHSLQVRWDYYRPMPPLPQDQLVNFFIFHRNIVCLQWLIGTSEGDHDFVTAPLSFHGALPRLQTLDTNYPLMDMILTSDPPRRLTTINLEITPHFPTELLKGVEKNTVKCIDLRKVERLKDLTTLANHFPNIEYLCLAQDILFAGVWDDDTGTRRIPVSVSFDSCCPDVVLRSSN